VLRLDSPRWWSCPCTPRVARTFSPLAAVLRERTTPGLSYLQASFAGLVSYGLSADLLSEVLPLGRVLHATTVRRQVQATAQRLENELGRRTAELHHRLPRRVGRAASPGPAAGRRPGRRLRPLLHGRPRARRHPRFVPLSPPAPASGSLSTSAATGVSDPGGGLVVGPVGIHGVVICGSVRSDRVGCRLDDVCASGGQACRNQFVVPGIAAGCDVRLRAVDFRVGPFPSNRPFIYIRCITACGCPTTQSAEHVDETRIR